MKPSTGGLQGLIEKAAPTLAATAGPELILMSSRFLGKMFDDSCPQRFPRLFRFRPWPPLASATLPLRSPWPPVLLESALALL